jgi:LEA14-like dessication related protein
MIAVFCGCATLGINEPEIRGVHPRITGIDFFGVNMAFDLDVYNPNFFAIRAPRLQYAFNVEGSKLFGAETTSSISLPQNGVGMVTFPVRVSYLDLIRTYQTLSKLPEAHYSLDGGLVFPAGIRKVMLPFSYQGTFPILRPPTFSDVKVNIAEVSPGGAKLRISALAKNPNVFPLGIENLGYALKLGDVRIADLVASSDETLKAGQAAPLSFTAEMSAASALLDLMRGSGAGGAALLPSGSVQTPYGPVQLQ